MLSQVMENQMERKLESEMGTRVMYGLRFEFL